MKPGAVVADRYTIEKELGRGGMGAVYVAHDRKFGARVALKLASASGLALDEFRQRFAREARIGHRLGRTEGFVRALDWGEVEEGASLYLAMDLVADARSLDLTHGTLAERLDRLQRAAKLVAQAHALGVVHRDLKPQNFLVAADGRIFLADFGLAKSRETPDEEPEAQLTRTGLGMGTPAYMPPEQFDDARSADERADVYALGVMLFVALAGKLPYDGSPTAIMQRHLRVQDGREPAPSPRALVPGTPSALDALCGRAMALDKAARLESAASFVAGLAAATVDGGETKGTVASAENRGTVAKLVTPPPASSALVRRVTPPPVKKAGAPGALGVGLAVVAIGVAMLFGCMALWALGVLSSVQPH